jgi:ketosteroid isomerase-like protein
MKLLILFCAILTLSTSCKSDSLGPANAEEQQAEWKDEIKATEAAFSEMAGKEGIATAFLAFAADDAVLMRNNSLVEGKEAIAARLNSNAAPDGRESLSWEPTFVDVSSSGDLGYTYGNYVYSVTDSLGQKNTQEGIFHTVWKRQADGKWKFVWD